MRGSKICAQSKPIVTTPFPVSVSKLSSLGATYSSGPVPLMPLAVPEQGGGYSESASHMLSSEQ